MVRPKRAPNNIKKAANVGSHSNTTADLNLNDEDSLKKSNRTQKSDEDDDVPCKAKASRKPPKDKTDKTELVKEPRKRRMASLNAEFLVHYCTNTNNASQQAHEKRASESPSSSKRRRTVSNESKAKKGRPNTRTRKKKADSDHQEEEEEEKQPVKTRKSQKRRGRHKTVKVDDRSDSSVSRAEPLAPPVSSGRPKREASLRASAMIIQTNEIEKTRFQYYPSVGSANAAPPPPVTPAANSLTVSKSKADKSHFQVPNPPKALKNAKNKSDANLKHVSTATTLANSQAAIMGRNESPDDEESSSDVLIVSEKNSNGEFVLTEERLADHNKLYGSYSTGNGTFSTHTKDYINKWIGGLETAEDKPFPQEIIPIDSFGSKVLNDPQYLTVKSRQQPTQSKSVKSTVGQQTKAKETVQPVKPALQTNQTTKNEQKQNDLDPKPDQANLNSASTNRLQSQFPFQLPFDHSTPSSAWSYPPTAPRPKSPPLHPEHLTWTNIQSGSESVNQLIAAAVGCSLSNPIGFFNSHGLTKSMSLPPHTFPSINPHKPSFMMPSALDSSNQSKLYLANSDYYQDPTYLIPSYAKLKLKSEKLMDMRNHQHAAAAAAAAAAAMHQMPPMINVENVNFYGSLDEQQKAAAACFLQHQQDPCCGPNSASANQATTAAAAAAAAVAMNIAKILKNQGEDKSQVKVETKTEPESNAETAKETRKHLDTESVVSVSSNSSDVKVIKSESSNLVKDELMDSVQIKKEMCHDERMEEEEDKKSYSSSLSSSVHLIVDETSMIVNENLESQMNVESEEMVMNDKTDSNSNTNMNVDSVNVNLPLESNSNMIESESTMDCRSGGKSERLWILNSEPLGDRSYSSIRNKSSNLIVNVNDCVLFERETADVVNESSNTNYSYDENDCSLAKKSETFAQIKSIKIDPSRDKILIHVKVFYKPEQIKNEIKNLNDSIKFEENELISSQDVCEQQVLEPEHIKSKSILSDHTNYLKMTRSVNACGDQGDDKIYFYRYDYDLSKKEINLIVEK